MIPSTKPGTSKPKLKTCKICKTKFLPRRAMQSICHELDCAFEFAKRAREKKELAEAKQVRRIDKERKEKLKSRSDYLKEAQTAFNAFIRCRDRMAGYLCISSDAPLKWDTGNGHQVDAGHYRSVGSAPHLRFDERNCHAQSVQDNRYGSGNAVDYRIGLINRIGLQAVEALEADQTVRKWSIDELRAIKQEYRAKLKALQSGQIIHHHTEQ